MWTLVFIYVNKVSFQGTSTRKKNNFFVFVLEIEISMIRVWKHLVGRLSAGRPNNRYKCSCGCRINPNKPECKMRANEGAGGRAGPLTCARGEHGLTVPWRDQTPNYGHVWNFGQHLVYDYKGTKVPIIGAHWDTKEAFLDREGLPSSCSVQSHEFVCTFEGIWCLELKGAVVDGDALEQWQIGIAGCMSFCSLEARWILFIRIINPRRTKRINSSLDDFYMCYRPHSYPCLCGHKYVRNAWLQKKLEMMVK